MDRRVLRERMRRKQRQIRRRKIIKLVTYVVAMVLAVIFVIRGVIFPIVSRIGGKSTGSSQQVQADAEGEDTSDSGTDSTEAQRQPLKGQSDVTKVASLTPGWHEDDNGRCIRMRMVHITQMVLQKLAEWNMLLIQTDICRPDGLQRVSMTTTLMMTVLIIQKRNVL